MRLTLLAAALLAASPALAQTTAEEAAALQSALERGRLLYTYDQAAWHGTDDMLTRIKDPQGTLGGWIVDGPADAAQLIFYDKDSADPHAVYVASFKGTKLVASHVLTPSEDRSLSPARKRMIAAVRSASTAMQASAPARCVDRPFNTVVLPPSSTDAPVSVYFLTPQTDMKVIPFGGHYRTDVSADNKAGAIRPFTKSCITLDRDPAVPEKGGKPVALVISHLLDPTPTEIHVFSSLVAKKPVYVITPGERIWAVDRGDTIRLVDGGKKGEKSAPPAPPRG